jgi:hypothetical protein
LALNFLSYNELLLPQTLFIYTKNHHGRRNCPSPAEDQRQCCRYV